MEELCFNVQILSRTFDSMMVAVLPDDIYSDNLQLWMIPYIYVIDPQWAQQHIYVCRLGRWGSYHIQYVYQFYTLLFK